MIIMIIRAPWPPTAHFHHHPDPSYKGLPKHPFHYLASYYKRTHFHHHRNKRYKRSGPKLLKIVGYEGKLHQPARLGETHLSQNGSLANCAMHALTPPGHHIHPQTSCVQTQWPVRWQE